MSTIGFRCSHEQIAPGRLLRDFGERVLPQLALTAPAPATADRPAREREEATR